MRREKWLIMCMSLVLIQLVACERGKMKEDIPAPIASEVSASRTDSAATGPAHIVTEKIIGIKRREPCVFTLVDSESENVKWRVLPYAKTYDEGLRTTIFFEEPGKRRVFAIDSLTNDTTFIDVEVSDEIFVAPQPGFMLSPDDELIVTPVVFPDSSDNRLLLSCRTARKYPCESNDLTAIVDKDGNNYSLRFDRTLETRFCKNGKISHATGGMADYFPANFEGALEISFNDRLYKGTFKRTGKSSWEFYWPYEKGIVFTKKTL